ncbi:MAG: hypothetical protein LUE86_10475 [Clostridiales bacterium]|nr:hypothetical protein [Clostridiales bacterium]
MRWMEHLYVGEKAGRRGADLMKGLREERLQPDVYVITSPQCGHHILDIWPSVILFSPPYRKEDIRIIGVAVTYWEALEVVRQIVDEMYRQTGGFCLNDFLAGRDVCPADGKTLRHRVNEEKYGAKI